MSTTLNEPAPALFYEQQGFLRPWWGILVVTALLLFATTTIIAISSRHLEYQVLKWVLLTVPILLFLLFIWLKLETSLDIHGISYRMRPFKWHYLPWSDVQRAYLKEYSPISEFGGWGIKGYSRKNMAFNVSGNQGLQLELTDGRRILLGTQQPEKLRHALERRKLSASYQPDK